MKRMIAAAIIVAVLGIFSCHFTAPVSQPAHVSVLTTAANGNIVPRLDLPEKFTSLQEAELDSFVVIVLLAGAPSKMGLPQTECGAEGPPDHCTKIMGGNTLLTSGDDDFEIVEWTLYRCWNPCGEERFELEAYGRCIAINPREGGYEECSI